MKNIDYIKSLDVEDMAEFLEVNASTFLVMKVNSDWIGNDCLKQWLNEERNG